jgi:hypothetical protein
VDHSATAAHPRAGGLALGRYRLVRPLGAGGMGVVWLAHDERLDRAVAVKRVPAEPDGGGGRAAREALAAARLSHPAIVALHEAGEEGGAWVLVSELVRGETLGTLLAEGALSDRDVLRIGVTLCDALAHAHAHGVVHRDVKPTNVVCPDAPGDGGAVAKLTDFGVAQLAGGEPMTRTGDIVGTLAYMAPEQAAGTPVGPPADVYALGLVVFEGLAGTNPVRAPGPVETARRLGARLPPLGRARRDLPRPLCRAVDAAVAPACEQRLDLGELRAALAAALPLVPDVPGTVAEARLPVRLRRAPPPPASPVGPARAPAGALALEKPCRASGGARPRARLLAGASAGALAAGALTGLPASGVEAPALAPATVALGLAALVAALPRAGWLAAAAALVAWVAAVAPGLALVLAAALVPVPLVLPRAAPAWSLPGLAPALGAVGLALAWPALAAQARRPGDRAALGALGAWWLVLAELGTGRRLMAGAPPGVAPRAAWVEAPLDAVGGGLAPLVGAGALLAVGACALASALLGLLVRGRAPALDLLAAGLVVAGVAGGASALAAAAGVGTPRGLVAGAVVATLVCVVGAGLRRR